MQGAQRRRLDHRGEAVAGLLAAELRRRAPAGRGVVGNALSELLPTPLELGVTGLHALPVRRVRAMDRPLQRGAEQGAHDGTAQSLRPAGAGVDPADADGARARALGVTQHEFQE